MLSLFKKYGATQGEATRSEYWGVLLVTWGCFWLSSLMMPILSITGTFGAVIGILLVVAVCIGTVWLVITTTVRRCRNSGINGWFTLTLLIPYVNFIPMIVFGCIPQKPPVDQ